MRWVARLGAANAALVSLYFAPAWGIEAVQSLRSPYLGLEHKGQAAAAAYYRAVLDLGPDGFALASQLLSGIKLVVAAAFLAYLIDVARALVGGREPDRATLDLVLVLGGGVAANRTLLRVVEETAQLPVICPPPRLCTDNAAMIAAAGYFRYRSGYRSTLALDIEPSLPIA